MAAYTYKQVYDRLPHNLIQYYGPALDPGYDGELHSAAADYIDRLQRRIDRAEGLLRAARIYTETHKRKLTDDIDAFLSGESDEN